MERPLYEVETNGTKIGVFQPGVGAPLAAALMEEVIVRGCRKIIACGGSGVLDRDIGVGNILIPTAVVRDECTSFHNHPPGREIQVDSKILATIENVFIDQGINKNWSKPGRLTPHTEKLRIKLN